MNYIPKGQTAMDKWRKFAAVTMERFPPAFLMVLFLIALFFALEISNQIPAIDWIQERLGIHPRLWQILFLLGACTIAYFRPVPKFTLLLSLPAAILGGGILWYGIAAGRDMVAMTFIFFCWLAIGVAMVVMVLYQEQLIVNEKLAEDYNNAIKKVKEQENVATSAIPAQS